jgi:hypothetical protein
MLMARFLQGEYIESIAWLEKKETKTDLYQQYANTIFVRSIIAPVTIFGNYLFKLVNYFNYFYFNYIIIRLYNLSRYWF